MNVEFDVAGFQSQLTAFNQKAKRKFDRVWRKSTEEVERSVVHGDGSGNPNPITAAPGQPIDTGFLVFSWRSRFEGPYQWFLFTDTAYAPVMEGQGRDPSGKDRPEDLISMGGVGRPKASHMHSVKLTRGAWQRVVDYVATEVGR